MICRRKATSVFGDTDEARVRSETEALQKMLGQPELESGVQQGTQIRKSTVRCCARVVEAHRQVGAGLESLGVGEILGAGVLGKNRCASEHVGG
jgi:hypothetical protein